MQIDEQIDEQACFKSFSATLRHTDILRSEATFSLVNYPWVKTLQILKLGSGHR